MSADQVTSVAGGASGTGLGSVTGALQGGVNNLVNLSSNYLDRFFPPEKREAWKSWLVKFATERPYLASFLLSQIALSGPALALFLIMSLTVFIFALLAGILVGLIGALVFVVVAVGFALLVLLPTLFFTTAAAVFLWLWGAGAYFIIKWFNQKDVPGVHTDVEGGLMEASGLKDLPGLNGEPLSGGAPATPKEPPARAERPNATAERGGTEEGGTTSGAQHHADGKENQGHPRKSAGRANGGVKDATGAVGGVGKKVGIEA